MAEEQTRLADLLPDELAWEPEEVSLFLLPDLPGPEPDARFVASVREAGVLTPVLLLGTEHAYEVIDGRRRIKAARLAGLRSVPARVAESILSPGVSALTLVTNSQRSSNPVAEWDAIEHLLQQGRTESQVAHLTGMTVQTIRKRAGLLKLHPELLAGFRAGRVTVSVAEAAAKLPLASQDRIVAAWRAAEDGKLTMAMVEAVREARANEAIAALPSALFALEEPATSNVEESSAALVARLTRCLSAIEAVLQEAGPTPAEMSAALRRIHDTIERMKEG